MANVARRDVLVAGAAVASVLAGCSGDGGGNDPAARGPIAIEELAFAAERPGDRDEFETQPEATYAPGDLVWLYADFSGLSGEPVGTSDDDGAGDGQDDGTNGGDSDDGGSSDGDGSTAVEIDLHQQLRVEDPSDAPIVTDEATVQERLTVEQLSGFYSATEILLPRDLTTGEYSTTLTVTDRISETDASATGSFRIEP